MYRIKLDLVKHLMIKKHAKRVGHNVSMTPGHHILFSLENDDMESSKRCVQFFSLVVVSYGKSM